MDKITASQAFSELGHIIATDLRLYELVEWFSKKINTIIGRGLKNG